MTYTAEIDPLCYPGTTVLRNRAGLTKAEDLEQFELAMFLVRADEPLPDATLDFDHYKALHRHLFQDVYEWAGETRRIRIGKGGNWFCYPEYIEGSMQAIFRDLTEADRFMGIPAVEFASRAAHTLAEINAVHPFREGNGRTQLTFLSLLIDRCGFAFDAGVLRPPRVIGAMIDSFRGDEEPLARLITDVIASGPGASRDRP